jgi:hypothetical protein
MMSITRSHHWHPTRLLLIVALVMVLISLAPAPQAPAAPAPPATTDTQTAPALNQEEAEVSQAAEVLDPLIFSDDFEAYGDSTLWSRKYPFLVQSNVAANGFYAARLINAGGAPVYGQKTFGETYPRVFVRLQFQILDPGNRATTLVNLRPSTTTSFLAVRIEPTGEMSYETGATGIKAKSAVVVEPNVWHDLQIFVDGNRERNSVRIWLDNSELTSMRQNSWLGDGGMKILQLGDNSANQSSDIAFDNIRVDDAFIPSTREADPVPGTLVVRAIPAWSGIVYELEGKTFVSDESGVARIEVERWSTDLRSRIKIHDAYNDNDSRASFSNWRNWLSAHSRDVYATFRISDPVTFSFVDLDGIAVENAMIDTLVIKSTTGDIVTLTGEQLKEPVLLTSTVITTPSGLYNKPISYVVDQVIIDGTNVVHRAQQRTTFEKERHWEIDLLFYGVMFRASDAFFGSPLGEEIIVEAADGSTQHLTLDANGEVLIPRLPRGEYAVSVVGAGYSPPRPIMVSRDQVVELEVISHLDVALVLSMAVFAVSGLLILGRPFLVLTPLRVIRELLAHLGRLRWKESAR